MNVAPTHTCRRDHRGWRGSFRLRARAEHCEHVEAARRRAEREEAERRAWGERMRAGTGLPQRRHPATITALLGATLLAGLNIGGRR